MGWLNNQDKDLPEKLRGKKPEDLLRDLEEGEQNKTKLTTVQADLDKSKNETASVKTELEQLKEKLKALEANPPRGGDGGGGSSGGGGDEGIPSVLTDEDGAFNKRMQPLIVATLQNSANTSRLLGRSNINGDSFESKIFKKYEAEVEDLFSKSPLNSQAIPGFYESVFANIKGRHMKDIAEMMKKEGGALFAEGGGAPGGDINKGADNAGGSGDKLTDEEIRIAARMRITPGRYMERKKKMKFVGV